MDSIISAENEILKAWEDNKTPLLLAPAGTGKTGIVREICQKQNLFLLEFNFLNGFENIHKDGLIRSIKKYSNDKNSVLFFDDLHEVTEDDFSDFIQTISDRRIIDYKIPASWKLVCSGVTGFGEDESDFKIKSHLDKLEKVFQIIKLNPENIITSWLEYAKKRKMHKYLISFIEHHPEFLFYNEGIVKKGDDEIKNWAVPGTWDDVNKYISSLLRNGVPVFNAVESLGPSRMGLNAYNAFKKFVKEKLEHY